MGEVEKDRTAAPFDARANIVVQHQDQVVNPVRALENLVTCGIGQSDWAVIGGTVDLITPAFSARQLAERKLRFRHRGKALALYKSRQNFEGANRCFSIPLALEICCTIAPKRTGNHQPSAR